MGFYFGTQEVSSIIAENGQGGTGAEYKSSLMATTTQSAYSPSIVSLSDYVLPDYTIEKGQTGLLYPKRTTQPVETENFTKVGNVIIENKVASGFSPSNYIKIPKQFSIGGSPFLIQMCFEHTSEQSNYVLAGSENSTIAISTQKGGCWFSLDGGTYNLNLSHKDKPFELNKKTWLQVERVNNTFWEVRRSYDGEEWESLTTANVSFNFLNISNLNIGFYGYEPALSFIGKVYLDECFINVRGKPFWQPYEMVGEYNTIIGKEDNFETYGVPTITESYAVSNFSATSYLRQKYDNTNTSYKCITRFKTGSSLNGPDFVLKIGGPSISYLNGYFWVWADENKYGTNVSANTTYWAGFTMKDGVYNLYIMVDNGMYTLRTLPEFSNSAWTHALADIGGTSITAIDKYIHIGRENDSFPNKIFTGTVYLKDTVLTNLDTGEELWTYKRNAYEYIDGICTKDFMPQVGTNTLNAYHIEYTDGTSECLLGQTEPTGEDIKSVQLLESGLTFEEDKSWTYNEDLEIFE